MSGNMGTLLAPSGLSLQSSADIFEKTGGYAIERVVRMVQPSNTHGGINNIMRRRVPTLFMTLRG
jgi:hypothetical protein